MKIRILPALAALALAGPLHAQGSRRIASFLYVPRADSATARDVSWTLLYATPGPGAEAGSITWGCTADGMMLAVTAPELAAGQPVRMVYRFDEGQPDTVAAATWPRGNAFSLPVARQRAFTLQAIGSRRLAVRLLHAGGESDRRFDLAGAMQALGMLPCVRELTGGPAVVVAPPTSADSARFGEYLLNAVEVAPRLTNARYVAGVLVQQYPPALRDAGVGGRVMLRVRVRQDGSLDEESIRVVSATHTEFIYPARRVAAEMRFTPGRVDGRPVTTIIDIPVQFQVSQ